jgi:hypothetical protein
MYRTTPMFIVTVAVVGLSASTSHAQGGDACKLLTTAQVTAALGAAVEAGVPLVASNPTSCGWAPPGGPHIDAKKVMVSLSNPKSFEASKKPMNGIEKTPLSGVGDDAIYITTPGFGTGLNVRKGTSAFQVRVGGFKPDKEKEIEKALAIEILKKL